MFRAIWSRRPYRMAFPLLAALVGIAYAVVLPRLSCPTPRASSASPPTRSSAATRPSAPTSSRGSPSPRPPVGSATNLVPSSFSPPDSDTASRYFHRLPPSVVRRLLEGKGHGLSSAIEREGFRPVRSGTVPGVGFRRWSAPELLRYLRDRQFDPLEVMAVAPLLGSDPQRIEAASASVSAWTSLLQWEESVGRDPDRWPEAAAVIVVAQRTSSGP